MKPMRFFIDTHDRAHKTFPEKLSPEDFEGFYAKFEKACYDEGVVLLRVHVGYQDGRAFCFTMAPDAEAVRRAHERVGLPFDSITEVATATPGDTFFRRRAA
jgi:Nickel responsive protein SCO4226-like